MSEPTKAQLRQWVVDANALAYEATERAEKLAAALRTIARYAGELRASNWAGLANVAEGAVAEYDAAVGR